MGTGMIRKLQEAPCQCGKNEFKALIVDDKTVLFVCKDCGTVYKAIDVANG